MKNLRKNPLALTLGTTLLAGLASTAVYADAESPFAMNELSSGYMQLAEADTEPAMKKTEGSCGEAKCGANKEKAGMDNASKTAEGKCGDKKMEGDMKAAEGKCGDKKTQDATSTTPADANMKAAEGKCGDKKMPEATTTTPTDASMKAAEGKCGDKKMDDNMKKAHPKKHKSKKASK